MSKGLFQPPCSVHELHKDGQCEVAGNHTFSLHLFKKFQALITHVVLCTSIKQGIVHDLIRLQLSIFLHLVQDQESSVDVAILAMSLEHCAVCDHIGPHSVSLHISQNALKVIHATATCTCINQCVVHDNGQLNFPLVDFGINCQSAIHLLLAREALEHGTIDDGVECGTAALTFLHLVDKVIGAFSVPIAHDCLHHAPEGDACWLDVSNGDTEGAYDLI